MLNFGLLRVMSLSRFTNEEIRFYFMFYLRETQLRLFQGTVLSTW